MAKPQTATLGDFVKPSDKDALQRIYQKTEPIYIRKLFDAIGNRNTVGGLIGLTGSGLGAILSQNTTTLSNELAARYIWERDYAEKKIPVEMGIAVITAEPHQLKTIKDLVAAVGGSFQYVEVKKS